MSDDDRIEQLEQRVTELTRALASAIIRADAAEVALAWSRRELDDPQEALGYRQPLR